jgi:predicted amidophosphoribosyltransferase
LKYEEFPEFEQADRSIEAGLCPACGYKITDEKICPECELPLIIEDE